MIRIPSGVGYDNPQVPWNTEVGSVNGQECIASEEVHRENSRSKQLVEVGFLVTRLLDFLAVLTQTNRIKDIPQGN